VVLQRGLVNLADKRILIAAVGTHWIEVLRSFGKGLVKNGPLLPRRGIGVIPRRSAAGKQGSAYHQADKTERKDGASMAAESALG